MKKLNPLLLMLLSATFLSFAWYVYPFFAFIGFVPILLLNFQFDSTIKSANRKFFWSIYFTFLAWNIGVSWWIVNSTWIGAGLAFFINSFLMTIPVMLFRNTQFLWKESKFKQFGLFALPFFWIAFEFLHLNWDLTWTWLHLGNSFSNAHYFIQWYEYTGVLGGSAWILVINILIYKLLIESKITTFSNWKWVIATVFVPCLIGLGIYFSYKEKGEKVEMVVVQPNIDPYTQKFSGSTDFIPYEEQLNRLISLSASKLTEKTLFLLWPETSMPVGFDEDLIEDQLHIKRIRKFMEKYPKLTLIAGIDSYKIYRTEYDKTTTARYGEGVGWYDYFNCAIQIENNRRIKTYHKSKLVPGVEQMPYPALFKWIENFSIDMGGITGSLGTQTERSVFSNRQNIGAAPVICYESIFGEYLTNYVKNGANFIGIITNDAWWADTPGHVQHFSYASLRAIETRRAVARAANTGISGFISQKGDVISKNTYDQQDAMIGTIQVQSEWTFYVKMGDYLGKIAFAMSILILIGAIAMRLAFKKRK